MEKITTLCKIVTEWFCEIWDGFKEYMDEEDTNTRKQRLKTGFTLVLIGVVIGFIYSPIKKGISICSNNKNSFSSDVNDDRIDDENKTKKNKKKNKKIKGE